MPRANWVGPEFYEVVDRLRRDCLIEDGSLFTPGEDVWTRAAAQEWDAAISEFDLSDRSFGEKLRDQLAGLSPQAVQFAAESLYVALLPEADTGDAKKLEHVRNALSVLEEPVELDDQLRAALRHGIATYGQGGRNRRDAHLRYLSSFTDELKSRGRSSREALLANPNAFRAFAYAIPERSAQMQREALLHLLFPDEFESTVSVPAKRKIVEAFSDYVEDPSADLDAQIASIRQGLGSTYPDGFSFWDDEIRAIWSGDVGSDGGVGGWIVRGERAYGTNLVPRWLDEGFVSMGAAPEGEVKVGMTTREIMDLVAPFYPDETRQQLIGGANAGRQFASEMAIGDWVMTRDGPSVYVGRVDSEQAWHPDGEDGTARRRRVSWLNSDDPLPWAELPESLRKRASNPNTVWNLKDQAAVLASLFAQDETSAWSEYLSWAERIYSVENFDAVERDYKLEIAEKMSTARQLVESDHPDWLDVLRRAFGPPNNLTRWQANHDFLTWCAAHPDDASRYLLQLWSDPDALAATVAEWPLQSSPGDKISISSLLLFGVDATRYPFFRPTVYTRTLELLGLRGSSDPAPVLPSRPKELAAMLEISPKTLRGFLRKEMPRADEEKGSDWNLTPEQARTVLDHFRATPPDADDALGERYEAFVAILDEIIERLARRGTELRDRLDGQSVAWWLVHADPPAEWSEEEQMAFRAWRGETEPPPPPPNGAVVPAVPEETARSLHVPRKWLQEIVDLLNQRGQIVFYGPPGTGKTLVAQRLGELVQEAGGSYELVQFHPSYSYEDFFEGFRPVAVETGTGVSYALRHGPLRRAALRAADGPDKPHVVVIDEINRGNVAKIFGELFFLLEYRNRAIPLQYSPEEHFALPSNLYFIGTMNTADRSIALVDAALRRRFYFVPFLPTEPPLDDVLRKWLEAKGLDSEPATLLRRLNAAIGAEEFSIGPSYFIAAAGDDGVDLDRVWRFAIRPLLEEHYYGTGRDVDEFSFDALARGHADVELVEGGEEAET